MSLCALNSANRALSYARSAVSPFPKTPFAKSASRAVSYTRFPNVVPSSQACVATKTAQRFFSQKMDTLSSKAWSDVSPAPIHCFSVEEFGISRNAFLQENGAVFSHLPEDLYDVRREQIEFLQRSLKEANDPVNISLWIKYYAGISPLKEIEPFYKLLSDEQKIAFQAIKPYRWRAVSRFQLTKQDGVWNVKRVVIKGFSQNEALLENSKDLDWRKLPRYFSDIDEKHISLPTFTATLQGIAQKIHQMKPVRELDIVIHHMKVVSRSDRVKGNSPEGIHQDGYPFLVTALVVERENVSGGESQIFGPDKATKIFTSTLFPGQGILQPDLGTGLWHFVTPVKPIKTEQTDAVAVGHRSVIGFDIDIVQ